MHSLGHRLCRCHRSFDRSFVHRIQIIYLSHRCFWRGALAVFVFLVLGMVGMQLVMRNLYCFFIAPWGIQIPYEDFFQKEP